MSHAAHGPSRIRPWLGLLALLALASAYVWTEHRAHLNQALPYLPYLLFLACPLLHLFMHGGHRHGAGEHGGHADPNAPSKGGNP